MCALMLHHHAPDPLAFLPFSVSRLGRFGLASLVSSAAPRFTPRFGSSFAAFCFNDRMRMLVGSVYIVWPGGGWVRS